MQKDDLDAPGNAQTIVTMDYICAGTVPACSLGRCVVQAPFTCTLSSLLVSSLKCPEWWVITTILAISWYFCTSVHFSMAWLWRSLSQCIKPTRICRGSSSISSNILLSSSQSFLSPSSDHHLLGSPKKKFQKKIGSNKKLLLLLLHILYGGPCEEADEEDDHLHTKAYQLFLSKPTRRRITILAQDLEHSVLRSLLQTHWHVRHLHILGAALSTRDSQDACLTICHAEGTLPRAEWVPRHRSR